MADNYTNKTQLLYFWNKLKSKFAQKAISKSITLAAASWSSAAYTITDSDIGANDVVTLTLPAGTTSTYFDAIGNAKIACQSQAAGSIVLTALGTVPTIDIPVVLIIQGGSA